MSDDEVRTTIPPGTVLAGKYRVESVLGAGGMGVVVLATRLELHDHVAVKFLRPSVLENEEVKARFVREARAAVKIKSEHVARVIDVDRLENGAPYMVMEYVEGHDLGVVKHGDPLQIEDAVDYVIQACDAMAEAHSAGIVHRDLKPANLFLTESADGTPVVKVLDFGISKMSVTDAKSLSLTKTSTAMGSPLYMSPEQMRSAKDVDLRTDIWSLGVILFELLTGQLPFVADSLPELCALILAEEPRALREFRPEVPKELEDVVLRCLQKRASERYANVAELVRALLPFAPPRSKPVAERVSRLLTRAGLSTSVPPPASSTQPTGPSAGGDAARTNASWSETHAGEPARRGLTRTVVAVLALGAVGIGTWFVTSRWSHTNAEPVPAAANSSESASAAPSATPAETAAAPSVAPPASTPEVVPSASAAPVASAAPKATARVVEKPRPRETSEPKKETPPPPPPKPKNPLDIGLK